MQAIAALRCLGVLVLAAVALALPLSSESHSEAELTRIAFGSCNKHDLPQPLWPLVTAHKPQLWVWLGDTVYADTRLRAFSWTPSNETVVAAKYATQRQHPAYRALADTTPVVGVWDDHDFNQNDGGAHNPTIAPTKRSFLRFLDEPADSARWRRGGVYAAYTFGPPRRRVHLILLDVRTWQREDDLLGEEQWSWLEQQLNTVQANVTLIGSGIQVLTDTIVVEKWARFPKSQQRLFELIRRTGKSGVIFLSGDVHMAETICRRDVVGYPLWEFTSSGLTHACDKQFPLDFCRVSLNWLSPVRYRADEVYVHQNFASLELDWDAAPHAAGPTIRFDVHGLDGRVHRSRTLPIAALASMPPAEAAEAVSAAACPGQPRRPQLLGAGVALLLAVPSSARRGLLLVVAIGIYLYAKRARFRGGGSGSGRRGVGAAEAAAAAAAAAEARASHNGNGFGTPTTVQPRVHGRRKKVD